jgi:thioredoxin reductase
MRMDRAADVDRVRAHLDRQRDLADQVARVRADDAAAGESLAQTLRGEGLKARFAPFDLADAGQAAALAAQAIALSPRGEIEVDARGQTSLPGVFAAGDATTVPYKQIIIAMGEGSKAALGAFDHLIRASAPAAPAAAA